MSMYPLLWAIEHAPVRDAEERVILITLVSKGDFDGNNCWRSYPTIAKFAKLDVKTVGRHVRELERRGVLRRDSTPPPRAYLNISADRRPVRWEVMIPASFWSEVQLQEINEQRAERGRLPITRENRPDLAPAPPKKTRSDKGTKRPERTKAAREARKAAAQGDAPASGTPAGAPGERGDSKSPRSGGNGGTLSPLAGGLIVPSRGDSESPNLPSRPSDVPSSSSYSSVTDVAPSARADAVTKEEEGTASPKNEEQAMHAAHKVLDDAVSTWQGHRAPTAAERRTLALRVAEALAEGATPWAVQYVLTRDLERTRTRNAVAVVMHRTVQPEWWREAHVPLQPTTAPKPPWCGACSESTRLTENAEGKVVRCKDCHPNPHTREEDDALAVDEHQANEAPGRVPAEAASVRSQPCAEHGHAPRNPDTGECSRCAMAAGAAKFKTPTAKKPQALTA
ncbi:helix-turn-helix domain-containing protein [Actinocorallia sp. B10E7]|uniref:helix-turn-helix domain-containing protein n=1 Tax=Actinocorallia sp. B10E7 TaxID=3153558 RepID=UPI00325CDDE9